MSLAPRPSPHLAQRLTLGPRLSESLRILALPAAELASLIEAKLDINPVLERPDSLFEDSPDEPDSVKESADQLDWGNDLPPPAGGEPSFDEAEASEDLYSHLARQLALERLSEREGNIALAVIDALDEDGYLRADHAALAAALDGLDPPVGETEIEAAICRVQQLDPTGVAARNPAECLLLQLAERPRATPGLALARYLLAEHCEALAQPDHDELARRIGCDREALSAALALIRSLDPYPGYRIGATPIRYLVPDLIARRGPDGWRVKTNPAAIPRLLVNGSCAAWLGAHRREPGYATLAAQLEEAHWLLHSLAQRRETMLRVGQALVTRQAAFLEAGPAALRPLTRRAVALELGLHESTVARAVQHKSLAAPRGIIPLRNFFSATLSRLEGGDISAIAVRMQIESLIAAENPAAPLSDAAIVAALAACGVRVARRTVTKYRETAGLPSARSRKGSRPSKLT